MNRYNLTVNPKMSEIEVGQVWQGKPNTMYRDTIMRIQSITDHEVMCQHPTNPLDHYYAVFSLNIIRLWFYRHE